MKIHYSCMPNIKPKISTHNKKKRIKKTNKPENVILSTKTSVP